MEKSFTPIHPKFFGEARHSRALTSAVFLLLSILMLIPCSAMAEGESNGSDEVTFTCISANPEGFYHEEDNFEYLETVDERAHNLFDGNTDTKWCFDFSQKAYVIFKASRLGAVSGYTITTGNDSGDYAGRNPKSWTLYGSNDQKNWTIIDQVSNDVVLQDENATAYNYKLLFLRRVQIFQVGDNRGRLPPAGFGTQAEVRKKDL